MANICLTIVSVVSFCSYSMILQYTIAIVHVLESNDFPLQSTRYSQIQGVLKSCVWRYICMHSSLSHI